MDPKNKLKLKEYRRKNSWTENWDRIPTNKKDGIL